MREIKRLLLAFLTLCFVLAPATVSFAAEDLSVSRLEPLSKEEEEIILNNLSIEKSDLSKEEQIALLTKGTAVVWDKTYKNEYNVKKSFSMSASLVASGDKPYTNIKITNTGSNEIKVLAYKGSVGGSTTIRSMTVPSGKSKTMTITRGDVIKYGNMNGQGDRASLTYTVSAYNKNGSNISFKAYAKRYD